MIKKLVATLGLLPGCMLIFVGGYNAALTLIAQVSSDFVDSSKFSLVYLFTPYTSVGGSGTFLDSIIAGPGASGGSAIRYWTYIVYAFMAAAGYAIVKACWEILIKENKLK